MARQTRILPTVLFIVVLASCGESQPAAAPEPATSAEPKLSRKQVLKIAAEKLAKAKEEKREAMRAAGTAILTKKKLHKKSEKLEMEFTFKNTGDKDLTQAEGNLEIFDGAGEIVKNMKVPFRMEIKAGETVKKTGKFPVDKGDDNDVALVRTPLTEMTFKWNPTFYRFADGSDMITD